MDTKKYTMEWSWSTTPAAANMYTEGRLSSLYTYIELKAQKKPDKYIYIFKFLDKFL